MTITLMPVLFMLVGGALLGFASGKLQDIGRMLFFAGALAFALSQSAHVLHIGS
jgi:hypothetical protein